jgi:hypothetical protein
MCHLKKKLAEENNKNNQSRTPSTELTEITLFHRERDALLKLPSVGEAHNFSTCLCVKTSAYQEKVFHPPSETLSRKA